jgi:hypothetical protein
MFWDSTASKTNNKVILAMFSVSCSFLINLIIALVGIVNYSQIFIYFTLILLFSSMAIIPEFILFKKFINFSNYKESFIVACAIKSSSNVFMGLIYGFIPMFQDILTYTFPFWGALLLAILISVCEILSLKLIYRQIEFSKVLLMLPVANIFVIVGLTVFYYCMFSYVFL